MTFILVLVSGKAVKVHTNFYPPPIPIRINDWSAVTDDYEGGAPIGHGISEEAAVKDLIEQLEEE